ncbi:hypothetical protein DK26_20340 [Bosea sp. WAO]|uniref:hypothetical protein n=1 Tax=Bosea sp. WAO TaxID=406341 RepID=UPI00074A0100|nr:hypothetical protein [Bosea sp. WAO]KUL94063.1 hypothetical protein DK26_20340 [Bosea sp. WAO]
MRLLGLGTTELFVVAGTVIGGIPWGIVSVAKAALDHPWAGKLLRVLRWGLLLGGGYAFLIVTGIISR